MKKAKNEVKTVKDIEDILPLLENVEKFGEGKFKDDALLLLRSTRCKKGPHKGDISLNVTCVGRHDRIGANLYFAFHKDKDFKAILSSVFDAISSELFLKAIDPKRKKSKAKKTTKKVAKKK